MARLRGIGVTALVRPDNRQMKTKFGQKLRPEFTILEWRDLGAGDQQPAQLPPPTDKDPAGAAAKPPAEKKTTIGKPVKPVTQQEEIDDEIPF
jgi:hypothetical protein